MRKMQLPLLKGDKNTNLDYRDLLPVNMMPVIREVKGDQGYLLTVDGLKQFSETSGTARGGYYNENFNKHFRVSGDKLESINTNGTIEVIGVIPGNGICKFFSSFNTQAILADGRLFLYDNATLREVKDRDLGFPIDGTWFRGLYVFTDGATVYNTKITDEFEIGPLSYLTSEFSNDKTVAVRQTRNNNIIVFNETSIEHFFFNPNTDPAVSPLQPIQGKSLKIGAVSANSVCEMDSLYFCIGRRPKEEYKVYAISGAAKEEVVSTRHINQILENKTKQQLQNAYIESRYSDHQHVMIVHLDDCTLAYNHSIAKRVGINNAWSVLKTGEENDIYRAKFGVFDPRVNEWIYGDILENKLGYLVSDTASQYGDDVECICYTPVKYLDGNIVLQNLTLQNIPGFSVTDTTLFYSFTDEGVIYGQESTFNISQEYKYKRDIMIRCNGLFSNLMGARLRFVSKSKQAISGCVVEFRHRSTS